MSRRAWAICVLLAVHSTAVHARSDEDKLVRDYAKTLAKDRDAKDRADAARGLGGRKQPEAVAALAKALSDPDASVRETAASALWKTGKDAGQGVCRGLQEESQSAGAHKEGVGAVKGCHSEALRAEGSRTRAATILY